MTEETQQQGIDLGQMIQLGMTASQAGVPVDWQQMTLKVYHAAMQAMENQPTGTTEELDRLNQEIEDRDVALRQMRNELYAKLQEVEALQAKLDAIPKKRKPGRPRKNTKSSVAGDGTG